MKILSIVFWLLILSKQATVVPYEKYFKCSCINAMQQLDCLTAYCDWDADSSSCTNKPCSKFS